MARAHQPRLPVEPLIRAAGLAGSTSPNWMPNTQTALAEKLGVPLRSVVRYIAEGGIPYYAADRFATKIGCHPAEVWADWWDTEPPSSPREERRNARPRAV